MKLHENKNRKTAIYEVQVENEHGNYPFKVKIVVWYPTIKMISVVLSFVKIFKSGTSNKFHVILSKARGSRHHE